MSLKNLFKSSALGKTTAQDINQSLESTNFLEQKIKDQQKINLNVDFSRFSNFARYGSALKYVEDTANYILNAYPFDGSRTEDLEWRRLSYEYDRYVVENEWPSRLGYIALNQNLGTENGSVSISEGGNNSAYKTYDNAQYIKLKGGPNATETFKKSNLFDKSLDLESNLQITPETGNCVEFWVKEFQTSNACVILDIWNGAAYNSGDYARLTLEYIPEFDSSFYITYASGAAEVVRQKINFDYSSLDNQKWNHFAFNVSIISTNVSVDLYVNSEKVSENLFPYTNVFETMENTFNGTIGASFEQLIAVPLTTLGYGVGIFKMDEFRFWKKSRTEKEIKFNWAGSVFGGSNTDSQKHDLGLYLKFNEGVYDTATVDSRDAFVLDYSGRNSISQIENYTIDCKIDGSAMNEADKTPNTLQERPDPIIFGAHPKVQKYIADKKADATLHDSDNGSSLSAMFPDYMIEEDFENNGELSNLLQIVGSEFDRLFLFIENSSKQQDAEYLSDFKFSDSLAKQALASHGISVGDLFAEASGIEELISKNEDGFYKYDLENIKNILYKNLFNNLTHLNKSKGSFAAFQSSLRTFGLGDELLRISVEPKDKIKLKKQQNYKISKKNTLKLSRELNFQGTVYQDDILEDQKSLPFIAGSTEYGNLSQTTECLTYIPPVIKIDEPGYVQKSFTKASIFGAHEGSVSLSQTVSDVGNFVVFHERDTNDPFLKRGRFVVEFDNGTSIQTLQTPFYEEFYSGALWNLCFSIQESSELSTDAPGFASNDFDVVFRGVTRDLESDVLEFDIRATISQANGNTLLSADKRFFVGADYTDFSNSLSVVSFSDVDIVNLKHWRTSLETNEILEHLDNPDSRGVKSPSENLNTSNLNLASREIPKSDSLVLFWDFDSIEETDSIGTFQLLDLTGTQESEVSSYSGYGTLFQAHFTGKGNHFPVSSKKVTDPSYLQTRKLQIPGEISYSDTIRIPEVDDLELSLDRNSDFGKFRLEKSPILDVNQKMLEIFNDISDYSFYVSGVERYRTRYKALESLRNKFFKKFNEEIDIEKYFSYFKWIDSSLVDLISQFLPDNSGNKQNFSNVVESHIFDRAKYQYKYNDLYPLAEDQQVSTLGSSFLKYSWKNGHNEEYADSSEKNNAVYWKTRHLSTTMPERNLIRAVVQRRNYSEPDSLYDIRTDARYDGNSFVKQSLGTLGDLEVSSQIDSISLGINKNGIDSLSYDKSSLYSDSASLNISTDGDNINVLDDVDARFPQGSLVVRDFSDWVGSTRKDRADKDQNFIEQTYLYSQDIRDFRNISKYNSERAAVQGTFTRQWVGGYAKTKIAETTDDFTQRPELYKVTTSSNQITLAKPDINQAKDYFLRDRGANSVVNIENHKSTLQFVGNYNKLNEIVFYSGRRGSSKWYINNSDQVPANFLSSFIDGYADFTLPDRDIEEHLVVTRFVGAFGPETQSETFLDYQDQEKSAYNSVNYKNLNVRTKLNEYESAHETNSLTSPFYSYNSSNTNIPVPVYGLASFHKNPSNSRLIAKSLTYEERHDNGLIQTSIPSNAFGIGWVDQGTTVQSRPTEGDPITRRIGGLTGDREEYQYIFKSNAYFNNSEKNVPMIYDPTSPTDYSFENTHFLKTFSDTTTVYDLNYGRYGWNTWRQVRVNHHPEAREQREFNQIPDVVAGGTEIRSSTTRDFYNEDNDLHLKTYRISNYNPVYFQWLQPSYGEVPVVKAYVSSSGEGYYNLALSDNGSKERFTNIALIDLDVSNAPSKKTEYSAVKSAYLSSLSGINLVALSYMDSVYPNRTTKGDKLSRERVFYDDDFNFYGSNQFNSNVLRIQFKLSDNERNPYSAEVKTYNGLGWSHKAKVRTQDQASYNKTSWTTNTRIVEYTACAWPLDSFSTEEGNNGSGLSTHKLAIGYLNSPSSEYYLNQFSKQNQTGSISSDISNDSRIFTPFYYDSDHYQYDVANDGIEGELTLPWRYYSSPSRIPFLDSYDVWNQDVKPYSKNRSQLPEYTVSDSMKYYVIENDGNFTIENKGFLRLYGASLDQKYANSSVIENFADTTIVENKIGRNYNVDFFRFYGNSSKIRNASSEMREHLSDNPNFKARFKIEADVLKKFKPYNGFFPAQRMSQLTEMFVEDYMPNVYGSEAEGLGEQPYTAMQAFTQPFYAPGIGFNSIKSGIAVDWGTFQGRDSCEEVLDFGQEGNFTAFQQVSNSTESDTMFGVNFTSVKEDLVVYKPGSYSQVSTSLSAELESRSRYALFSTKYQKPSTDEEGPKFIWYSKDDYETPKYEFDFFRDGLTDAEANTEDWSFIGNGLYEVKGDIRKSFAFTAVRESSGNAVSGYSAGYAVYMYYVWEQGNSLQFIRVKLFEGDGASYNTGGGEIYSANTIEEFPYATAFSVQVFDSPDSNQDLKTLRIVSAAGDTFSAPSNIGFDVLSNRSMASFVVNVHEINLLNSNILPADRELVAYGSTTNSIQTGSSATYSVAGFFNSPFTGNAAEIALNQEMFAIGMISFEGFGQGLIRMLHCYYDSSNDEVFLGEIKGKKQNVIFPLLYVGLDKWYGFNNSVLHYIEPNYSEADVADDGNFVTNPDKNVIVRNQLFTIDNNNNLTIPVLGSNISRGNEDGFANIPSNIGFSDSNIFIHMQSSEVFDIGSGIAAQSSTQNIRIYDATYGTFGVQTNLKLQYVITRSILETSPSLLGGDYVLGYLNSMIVSDKGNFFINNDASRSTGVYHAKYCDEIVKFRSTIETHREDLERGYAPYFYTQKLDFKDEVNKTRTYKQRTIERKPNLRIPFEAIVDPSLGIPITPAESAKNDISTDSKIWFINPESYPVQDDSYIFPYAQWTGEERSPLYRLAANNFYGEVVRFFNKNSRLTTFTSLPQEKFRSVVKDRPYYMDIEIYSQDFNPILSKKNSVLTSEDSGKFFGPHARPNSSDNSYSYFDDLDLADTDYDLVDNRSNIIKDPSHAPWVPPYYYGKSVARIKYTPTQSGRPTLGDILANSEVQYITNDAKTLFESVGDGSIAAGLEPTSAAYQGMMNIEASVELFAKTKVKKVSYGVDNVTFSSEGDFSFVPVSVDDGQGGNDGDAWAIYPKWECPILRPSDQDSETDFDTSSWFSGAELLNSNEGVFLRVKETPDIGDSEQGSLIKVCGFTPSETRLGEVAEEKTLEEAIVLVPYLDTAVSGLTHEIGGFQVISVDRELVETTRININSGNPAIKVGDLNSTEDIPTTSISRTLQSFKKYNAPPFMDYYSNRNIQPFVAYFIEFDETIKKEDLAKIWNNELPSIGSISKLDIKSIEHDIDQFNFFEGKLPDENMKFLVFKVKRKSEKSYFNLTAEIDDDSRFNFDIFENGSPTYSYNWPYDFCSLIELGSINAGIEIVDESLLPLQKYQNIEQATAIISDTVKPIESETQVLETESRDLLNTSNRFDTESS